MYLLTLVFVNFHELSQSDWEVFEKRGYIFQKMHCGDRLSCKGGGVFEDCQQDIPLVSHGHQEHWNFVIHRLSMFFSWLSKNNKWRLSLTLKVSDILIATLTCIYFWKMAMPSWVASKYKNLFSLHSWQSCRCDTFTLYCFIWTCFDRASLFKPQPQLKTNVH